MEGFCKLNRLHWDLSNAFPFALSTEPDLQARSTQQGARRKEKSGRKLAKSEGVGQRAAGGALGLLQTSTPVQVCRGRSKNLESLHPSAICARRSLHRPHPAKECRL